VLHYLAESVKHEDTFGRRYSMTIPKIRRLNFKESFEQITRVGGMLCYSHRKRGCARPTQRELAATRRAPQRGHSRNDALWKRAAAR
jgi:hypothetical protein